MIVFKDNLIHNIYRMKKEVLLLKVAICDDNPTLTEKINTMLFNYNPNIFETYTYYNPLKLVNQLDQENFDFLF